LERLLGELERREIELGLASEELERARGVIRARGWDEEWGDDAHLLVLAHGLAVLELSEWPRRSSQAPERPASIDGLRYRVFELGDAIRILQIRETAFRIDNQGMRLRLAQLQQEVAELEAALAAQGGRAADQPSGGFLRRLFRRPDQ
jgi:hypothetical protein